MPDPTSRPIQTNEIRIPGGRAKASVFFERFPSGSNGQPGLRPTALVNRAQLPEVNAAFKAV